MKALRFLGVAILACSMLFVSCKKDKQYTITVNSNNTAWGTVTGGGTYAENATATLTATANAGYKFVQWNDGNTANPRTITVTADATYTATFAEEGTPGPNPPQPSQDGVTISFNNNQWQAAGLDGVDDSEEGCNVYYIWKTYQDQHDVYLQGWLQLEPGNYDYQSSNGDYFKYRDESYIWTDVNGDLGEAGAQYYGWTAAAETFVESITAIDLNACTISATFSEEIADIATITFDSEGYVEDWGPTKPLNGVMQNANWTWLSKKSNARKAKSPVAVAVR